MIEVLRILWKIIATVVGAMDDFRFVIFSANLYLMLIGIVILIMGDVTTANIICTSLNTLAAIGLFAAQVKDMRNA